MRKVLYPGLVAEMARRGDTLKTIGNIIDRAIPNVSLRFSGKKQWTISEIDKICNHYKKSYEELFK